MARKLFGLGPYPVAPQRYCICIDSTARKGKSLKEQRAMHKALEAAVNGKTHGYQSEKDANTVRNLLPKELRDITYVSPYMSA